MPQAKQCIISTDKETYYGLIWPLPVALRGENTGSSPVPPTSKKERNTMRLLELARIAVAEKCPIMAERKLDEFAHRLWSTKEGRRLRRKVLPGIARGIGAGLPLDD